MKVVNFFIKATIRYFLLGVLSISVNSIALNLGMTDKVYMPYQDIFVWVLLSVPPILYILLCIKLKKISADFGKGSTVLWLLACGSGVFFCMLPYQILMRIQ